jgi:hypothetical protein
MVERRAGNCARPIEPRREPVAVGHGEQQPRAAGKFRRPAADDIAQGLQIAAKPRRAFAEGGSDSFALALSTFLTAPSTGAAVDRVWRNR